MFLIEYMKGGFVNAETIDTLSINGNIALRFTLQGMDDSNYYVSSEYQSDFVNNLQALNQNLQNVESRYHQLTAVESKQ